MRVLVVGSGGREHALLWTIRRERPEAELWCAPGNAGTADLARNLPIDVLAIDQLADAVDRHRIDLTIVGPEAPLAAGLADRLRAHGRLAFGPSAAAARIEASKAWAKDVMTAAGVPTASSATFTSLEPALRYVDAHPEPLVVKASGLAAGKGAVVCQDRGEARDAVRSMLAENAFGEAGQTVVVEAFLPGEELSVLALTNGRDVRLLPVAQDHKRLLPGDRGPNTGGMGAYSPVSLATPGLLRAVEQTVLLPALEELDRRSARFTGVLYAGLMVDAAGAFSVVEFNCRFGDPEAETILPRIAGGLVDGLLACAEGAPIPALSLGTDAAVTTVVAARGYPDRPEKGAPIALPERVPDGAFIFHAGTTRAGDGTLRVNGGRVFAVTGTGPTFETAQRLSRETAERIDFPGKQFRPDIGWRETARAAG